MTCKNYNLLKPGDRVMLRTKEALEKDPKISKNTHNSFIFDDFPGTVTPSTFKMLGKTLVVCSKKQKTFNTAVGKQGHGLGLLIDMGRGGWNDRPWTNWFPIWAFEDPEADFTSVDLSSLQIQAPEPFVMYIDNINVDSSWPGLKKRRRELLSHMEIEA